MKIGREIKREREREENWREREREREREKRKWHGGRGSVAFSKKAPLQN